MSIRMKYINLGTGKLNVKFPSGYITAEEMLFVKNTVKEMPLNTSFLEIGSFSGKLLCYLYMYHPNWRYVAVDPLDLDQAVVSWHVEDKNIHPITEEEFRENCPFVEFYKQKFEYFESTEKFDIISIGISGSKINWKGIYKRANSYLKPGGIIIGRNYYHYIMGTKIQNALDELEWKPVIHFTGMFIIKIDKYTL